MLAKLKSRGLSGLAVRQRRWTSNEFEHPSFDDDGHVQPLSSPSQSNHADATATSSPLTPLASSPAHVATTDGEYDLQQPLVKSSGVVPFATPGSNDSAVARDVAPAAVPVKSGVSSATKKGFGALLRASKSGELERVAATIPADDANASVSHLITSAADCIAPHVAVAAWKTATTTTTNWHTNADSQHHTHNPSQFQCTADSQTINSPPPVELSSDVASSTNCSQSTQTAQSTAESDLLQSALLTADQKSSEQLQQLHDRESDHMQLKMLRHEVQERFADLQSSVTAVVTSSHQRLEKDAETPVVVGQLQQLTSGLSHLLSSISNTESRVRVELLKHDKASVIAEQELAQALADIVVLRRRNSDLEQELENLRGEGDGSINGYALRGSKFSSREKELENAVLELKNEVADRDKCILCLMEQMNAAAASHEEAVLLSTTLLHQQKTLNSEIERDRQRLLQSLEFYEGVIKQTDASSTLIRQQLSEATAENLELQRLIMNQDVHKHETDTKLRIMETNCAMAEIDRAVAQSIVDKRLALEESHFSQRMQRQQQLLDISEARVRELDIENKSLLQRLAAADAQRLQYEEAAAMQQLTLQRTCDELSDLKERFAETRDAGAIEIASATARHSREMLEQQRAAVESSRSFKAMLQQRDAKIAELSRLINALSPPKPQDFLMVQTRQNTPSRLALQPQAAASRFQEAHLRGTAPI